MANFRLFNIVSSSLEIYPIDKFPTYIAASHTWSENVFNAQQSFQTTFGGRGLQAAIDRLYPDVKHCWIDTICIDQHDEQDKLVQIPLMGQIFGNAVSVLIFISNEFETEQSEVDALAAKLEGALTMCKADAWSEEGANWQSGTGKDLIVQGMSGLLRLASTAWATRVWTLQEYVLAKNVIWIGLDLEPLTFDDYLLSALPDICDTLNITECLGDDMRVISAYFAGMANVRLGSIDRTRIMELLGNRRATVPADEVYGVMAASGVEIEVISNGDKLEVWKWWCEEAIRQGHIRWLLLPKGMEPFADNEPRSCILPCFAERHRLSGSSSLDHVNSLGSVTVENGCATLYAHYVGRIQIIQRLGGVYQAQSGRLHRDITLILFARARWRHALQLVSAFGGGRYDYQGAKSIARVLTRSYVHAMEAIMRGKEEDFRPVIENLYQLRKWNDFMSLQQSQMIGLNEGVGYLCNIIDDLFNFLAVLVTGGEIISLEGAVALNFEAKSPDGRFILMVARGWDGKGLHMHKIGMTLPVSDDLSMLLSRTPLRQYNIGGNCCIICRGEDNASSRERKSVHVTEEYSRLKSMVTERRLNLLKRDQKSLWSLSASNSSRQASRSSSTLRRRKLDALTARIKMRTRKLRNST